MRKKHTNRNLFRSLTALALAATMAFGYLPAREAKADPAANAAGSISTTVDTATADNWSVLNYDFNEGRTTKNDGRIWTDKSVYNGDATVKSGENSSITISKGKDSDFLIGLSALSSTMSVKGVSNKPLDIIMVLDVSGSMDEDMGYEEVYAGTMTHQGTYYIYRNNGYTKLSYSYNRQQWYYGNNNTITPKTSANDTNRDHVQVYQQITKMEALESAAKAFAATTSEMNAKITDTADQHRIALVKFSGNISTAVGNDSYTDGRYAYNYSQVVREFSAITSSNVSEFNSAVEALNPNGATRADNGMKVAQGLMADVRSDAQPVVIFFTDGVPTTLSQWDETVANDAIGYAKQMKGDGAWIFSVGVFEDNDSTADNDLNRYMNAVSSNYPNATGYTTQTMGTRDADGDYYKTAETAAQLADIFDDIAQEISGKDAEHPTHVEGYDASKGGYVTFVDKLGDYMEVKSVNSVVYGGVEYKNQITNTAWNSATASTDVFVSNATVKNDLGEDVSLGTIVVTVERSADSRTGDIVTVKIPAALIPLAYYNVTVTDEGAVTERIPTTPIRAFYEVGLKAEVPYLVSGPDADMKDYLSNHTDSDGKAVFYANAFDTAANATTGSTVATFTPAKVNDMYFAVEDVPIFSDAACTRPVTTYRANTTYYYQRVYYVESEDPVAPKYETVSFNSSLLSNVNYKFVNGQLVVPAGTARSTRADAYDMAKGQNNLTETAANVASPRWENWYVPGSEVSVYLGNNGLLTLVPEDMKTVSGTRPGNTEIKIEDGTAVQIGDQLTYTIKAVNTEETTATLTVTDTVPAGTKFVSAANGGSYNATTGVITWTLTNVAAGAAQTVSFVVEVTDDILDAGFTTVNNTAQIKIGNNPAYSTNTTVNPPSGKKVEGSSAGVDLTNGVKVGDELTYFITYSNDTAATADITITDVIPAGTTYLANSASHEGKLDDDGKTLHWTLKGVQPGATGTVSFRVVVNASAETQIVNDATIKIGENGPAVKTNPTQTNVLTGNIVITKQLVNSENKDKAFTLYLTEIMGDLGGKDGKTYTMTRSGSTNSETIRFINGKVQRQAENGWVDGILIHGAETLTLTGLPLNARLTLTEDFAAGYTASYKIGDTAPIFTGASVVVGSAEAVVINEYKLQPVTFQLAGTKTFTANEEIEDRITFTFTAESCDVVVNEGEITSVTVNDNIKVNAAVQITDANKNTPVEFVFSSREFTQATNTPLYYLVRESNSGLSGIVYDNTEYLLKVEITDNGAGELNVNKTLFVKDNTTGEWDAYTNDKVVFNNTYPDDIEFKFFGKKTLANKTLEEDEFSFVVESEAGQPVATGYNDEEGNIIFTPIAYEASDIPAGQTSTSFTYKIYEANAGGKVKYDASVYTVVVTLTSAHGVLTASITSVEKDGGAYNYAADGVVFANTYVPDSINVQLKAKKELDDDGVRTQLNEGEFSFHVLDPTSVVATGTNDADGNVVFSQISFDVDDMKDSSGDILSQKVFTYTMEEIIPDYSANPFIKYDESKHTVSITVNYNKTTGVLSIGSVTYDGNTSAPIFTNKVNNNYVEVVPAALAKYTSGENIPENAKFSFSIVDVKTGTVVDTGVGSAIGKINFNKITYTAAGVYQYWVQESSSTGSAGNGITYSTAKYLLTVTVSYDAAERELKAEAVYTAFNGTNNNDPTHYTAPVTLLGDGDTVTDNNAHFKNTYAAAGMATVGATKVVTGPDGNETAFVLDAGDFEFKLVRLAADGSETNRVVYSTMGEKGDINFANLYYTNEDLGTDGKATFIYKMSELEPESNKIPGIAYTNKVYYVKVELSRDPNNTGKIIAEESYYSDAACTTEATPTFTNVYQTVTDARTKIEVTKQMTGRTPAANEFGFELVHLTVDGDTVKQNVVETANNTAQTDTEAAKATFYRTYYAANFPQAEGSTTVRYLLREVPGSLGGVTYSTDVYGVEVVVENDTTAAALAVKSVTYYKNPNLKSTDTVDVAFVNELFNVDNKLTPDDVVVFTNAYKAKDVTVTPVATKVLIGRPTDIQKDEFSFVVRAIDESGSEGVIGAPVTTGENLTDNTEDNVKNALVDFGDIHYTDIEGTNTGVVFRYEISEVPGNQGGMTYSNAKYYMEVTVSDDGSGALTAKETYYKNYDKATKTLSEPITADEVVFTNTYSAASIRVQVDARKELTGRNLNASDFDFDLVRVADATGTPWPSGTASTVPLTVDGTNVSGTMDADSKVAKGDILFATMDFDHNDLGTAKSKTFYYKMTEAEIPADRKNGITQGGETYLVAITITDNENGTLSEQIAYSKLNASGQYVPLGDGNIPVFENNYSANPVKVNLTAVKTLENKNLKEKEFKFVLEGPNVDPAKNPAYNAEDGSVVFQELTFNAAGTYTYTVREDVSGNTTELKESDNVIGIYTNDRTEYTVVIEVTDDGKGQLHAVPAYYAGAVHVNNKTSSIVFNNRYNPAEIEVDLTATINATKDVISPDNITYQDKSGFTFTVYDIQNSEISHGISDFGGKITFEPFEFKTAGIYRYWIVEDQTNKPGVAIDSRAWELHIQVRYDVATGKLYVLPEDVMTFPMQRAEEREAAPVFENTYNPAPAEATVTLNKALTGRPLENSEFVFAMYEVTAGTTSSAPVAVATNGEDGKVSFTFNIDTFGTHEYKVVELIPDEAAPGMTYDKTAVEGIKIQVGNDQKAGKLVISDVTMPTDTTFENTYTAANTTAVIDAFKVVEVEGEIPYEMKGDEFTFQLVDSEGKVVAETKNTAGGIVRFEVPYEDAQLVDAAGNPVDEKVFTYTIKEVIPAEADRIPGMTYNEKEFGVTVTVTDDFAGSLKAKVDYTDHVEPVITNSYKGGAAKVEVEATKTLTGKSLLEGAYIFELVDADGKVVAEAKNDAEGKIKFIFGLDEVGEYTYTMREKAGTDANTTYDTNTYQVTVVVTDNMAGCMVAEVAYADGKAPTFNNTYTPNGIAVTLTGTKTLTGRAMIDGEFKFLVTDSIGALVATGTNAADGTIAFTEILIPVAGQYTLTVAEAKGNIAGITYDETSYQVIVDVTNEDGVLKAAITYPENGLKFNNKFVDLDLKETGDNTSMTMWTVMLIASVTAAGAVMVTRRRRRA